MRLFTLVLVLLFSAVAHAEPKRIALVMGNDAYQSVARLDRAGNDASAMARELKAAGFDVTLKRDLDARGMNRAVTALLNSINGGDQVVVFYSGHGVQLRSGTYLLPTDIEGENEAEVEQFAFSLDGLSERLAQAKAGFSLIMVDACRDNPFRAKGRSIGATRGLAGIEAAKGQMIVFSASKGQQALDSLGARDKNPNGVFTREFIQRMRQPGVRVEDLVREVQDSVETLAKTIGHDQRPALYNEARGNFYFFGPTTVQMGSGAATPAPARTRSADEIEDGFWDSIKNDTDAMGFDSYLKQYPQGRYAVQARLRLAKLKDDTHRSQAAASPAASPGKVFKDCADCPDMVVLPQGSFTMGSPASEAARRLDEGPQHTVRIDYPLAVGQAHITRGQYARFVRESGYSANSEWQAPGSAQDDTHPVVNVNWDDAQAYAQWLAAKTGKPYRLLSEAEWEYAARAGTRTPFYTGHCINTSQANYNGNYDYNNCGAKTGVYRAGTTAAGSFAPNAFGLYDMAGNAWSWTQDCWNANYAGAPSDGSAWQSGDCARRVLRGGSWFNDPQFLRAAARIRFTTTDRFFNVGFRVARTAP